MWMLSAALFFPAADALFGQQGQVRINEFMALNETSLADEDGDFSDWIELFNYGPEAVQLSGWALSDDPAVPYQWILPEVTLESQGYLVIFASGKNRTDPGSELHTSFKLSGTGEYLALTDPQGVAATEFAPGFPVQLADVSYGFYNDSYIHFSQSTPGSENYPSGAILPAPEFSVSRGIVEEPFDVEIISDVQGAEIFYTTDGSTPTMGFGKLYSVPIHIGNTTILRAVAVLGDTSFSSVATSSYLFLEEVIHQPNNPEGYPSAWGPYTAIEGTSVADYEMDPEMMADPAFAASVIEGLESLPTISLVTDIDYLFSHSTDPETGGIYIYTGPPLDRVENGLGFGWERPASIEYFNRDGSESFQVNCGVRIQGGHSRRPEKSPKHSFRLVFRNEYGPTKLNYPLFNDKDASASFNSLILRAGFGLSWVHHSHYEREQAQYQRDIWSKDTQRAMGHPSSHSEYVHLYINGIYWGVYAPSERMDSDFAASYMEGNPEDYDVIKDYQDVADGEIDSWNRMMDMVNAGVTDSESYQAIQGNNPDGTPNPEIESMVDVANLTDYMLINFYGGNTDWDHHNWTAMRNRVKPGKGFKFFCWDSEHILKTVSQNVLEENNDYCPSRIFQQLRQNEEFRWFFADRVHQLCFNGGLLTPGSTADRWNARSDQVETAIPAESARWGDYRRDVHPYQAVGPFDLYTYDDYWVPHQSFMLNTYFPDRTSVFLNQLRAAGLYPILDAPQFFINGAPYPVEEVSRGDELTMSSSEGIIYYAVDGSDPALDSDGISNNALVYNGAVSLDRSSHFVARTFLNGQWSAAMHCVITFPEDYLDIKITEVHYNPIAEIDAPGSDFEFVELKNTGGSTLALGGVSFVDGVEYTFPSESEMKPGGFMVVASSELSFYQRYGFLSDGEYTGNLNNGGEWIRLEDPAGDTIATLLYDNAPPWPPLADGSGYSLVPVEFDPVGDQNGAANWRSSHYIGGSPGRDDTESTAVEPNVPEPDGIELRQNYPNPFREQTYISYSLPGRAVVDLSVYNLVGQRVAVLETGQRSAGQHVVSWNGADDTGILVKEGVYFYRMVVRSHQGDRVITKKMIRF